jgi:protein-S-isoprenylcysteine O-methyltransferase Ste14
MFLKVRNSAGIYYLIQGIVVFVWWAVLYFRPEARQLFILEANSEASLLAFWLADISFLGFGSIVVAILCFLDHEYKRIGSWFVTGTVSYAAIYSFTFAMMSDHGWLGVTLMLPAMVWSGVFAVGMSFEKAMFRKESTASTSWIIVKTFVQIAVVWTIILGIFPYLITLLEDRLGITRLSFPYQRPFAALIFVLVSSIGVASAIFMCRLGLGTPLPLDHATKLVIGGPYAYVRNPMAVSGILQGLAVALFLGSPLVAVYALMGSAIWQLIFRPLEEDDLYERFGNEYQDYRDAVKCWTPRLKRFSPKGES